jgi:BASS family bile acid:Na+ symporter
MRAALAQTASIAVIVFAVSSMFSVGLAYSVRSIVGPLREVRAVFRALVANFVLVPLFAVAIERIIPIEPPLALGLFLLAASAGAPFLIKLASAARSDLALSAALLLLLVPATVVFLPFYVPLAMAHPSLSGLTYVPANLLAIGVPLLSTMILPLVVGLVVHATAPRWAARLVPIVGKLATVTLLIVVIATFAANFHEVLRILKTGAIGAALALIGGAFAIGYLMSGRDRGVVLGLATSQRNIAAAMVVASRSFGDPDVLVMVTASSIVGLIVLFPIAWLLSRRKPRLGPPTKSVRPSLPSGIPEPA